MKLVPTRNELQVIDFGLLSIRQTTQGIRKSIGKSIRADRQRDAERLKVEKQRMDADKKKKAESLVESKKSIMPKSGGMKKAINKAGNVFQGLLTAAGYILMEWLITNVPKLLVIADEIKALLTSIKDGIEGTFKNIGNIFTEIKDVAVTTWEMFTSFDFSEKRRKELEKEFQDFTDAVDKTGKDFQFNFEDIQSKMTDLMSQNVAEINKKREEMGLEPLTDEQARALAEKSPELAALKKKVDAGEMTQEEFDNRVNEAIASATEAENVTQPPAAVAASREPNTSRREPVTSQSNDPVVKRLKGLLKFISSGEGGYNSMNQGTKGNRIVGSTGDSTKIVGKKLTSMTIGEVMKRQAYLMDPSTGDQESDYGLFAVGRYQIIPDTMPTAVRLAGLKPDDMFSPENQDKLGAALIMSKPITRGYLQGKNNDLQGAMRELAAEWASLPDPRTGGSMYGSGNAAGHKVREVEEALRGARREYGPQSAAPISAPAVQKASLVPATKPSVTVPVTVPVATINNSTPDDSSMSGSTVASASASTESVVGVMQRINRKFT